MNKKKNSGILSLTYIILASTIIVLLGKGLFIPGENEEEILTPQGLLTNALSEERFISADELADKMINLDPSFILVDIRNEEQFADYSLPGSINIPLEKIFAADNLEYLDQDQFDIVFISNDHFLADQAWFLCEQAGFENLHVLEGGMNNWFETIINPKMPDESMPESEFELYATRKAASMFFGVVYPEEVKKVEKKVKPAPKKVVPVKKKKKLPVEGGC